MKKTSKPSKQKSKQNPGKSGARDLTVKVKTAKGRKLSSTRWLQRQLNDPYVSAAKRAGLRSRAAYKLLEIDEKYGLLKPGQRIIDLGAAPGGWSQVASQKTAANQGDTGENAPTVIAVDLTDIEPIPAVTFIQGDFLTTEVTDKINTLLQGEKVDGVISDMAAPSTGHKQTDHLRIMGLCEEAYAFARDCLAPGGFFLSKVLKGGTENDLLAELKRDFAVVRHVKPKASRQDSAEAYVLATGFRANAP